MPRRKKIPPSNKRQGRSSLLNWAIPVGAILILAVVLVVLLGNRPEADQSRARPLADISPLERNGYYSTPPEMAIDPSKDYTAVIETERGEITVDLYEAQAPITVNNFAFLAGQGYYDGVTFQRVIKGFMAQGGDPSGTGGGGPGYTFQDETDNDLTFDSAGLLAMANRGPGTNGSQFFITYSPQAHLTGLHTIFGQVVAGFDALESLTPRDPSQNPTFEGDLINRITILEDGAPF